MSTLNSKTFEEKLVINLKKNTFSIEGIMLRGYSLEDAEKLLNERINKAKRYYSSESIQFFKKYFKDDDWLFGENEWFIYDPYTKSHYFYDFTNLQKRIIIEYHGDCFHPNPKVLTDEEMKKWKHPFTNALSDVVMKKDDYKKFLSEQNLFRYFEIYSNDKQETIDFIIKQIEDLLNEKI